jgi:hypothetical protein
MENLWTTGAQTTPSPMRDKLVDSIFEAFRTPDSESISPDRFIKFINYFSLPELDFGELGSKITFNSGDKIVLDYYTAMGLDHGTINTGERIIPILSAKGITIWIMMQLWTEPEQTARSLTALLKNKEYPVLNKTTGEPFGHTTIPTELLPDFNSNIKVILDEAKAKWALSKSAIIKQMQEGYTFQVSMAQRIEFQRWLQVQNQQQLSHNTAHNTQMMSMSSLQASMAMQNYWNTRQNVAKMSWGNF